MPESTKQFSTTIAMQIKGALLLKVIADNESAILGTESNSSSVDRSVRSGW